MHGSMMLTALFLKLTLATATNGIADAPVLYADEDDSDHETALVAAPVEIVRIPMLVAAPVEIVRIPRLVAAPVEIVRVPIESTATVASRGR
jgi:hypothetical protein